ncbi:MAG: phosphodiester glycosidase family protein [Phycisphaerales bacterium]|nr:phosphodiester glycosidase family protein [Hyphomonadaceae bacterium]
MKRLQPLPLILAVIALIAGAAILAFQASRAETDRPCETREFEGSRFIVCAYNPGRHELRLASRARDGGYLRGFEALQSELGRDARRVRFAMNAGMYNDSGAPIGLYVENGERQHVLRRTDGPGNFHMKPNGVFWVGEDGAPHVDETDAYVEAGPSPLWATQSGPMLLIGGELHPRFSHDGASRYLRNGVGVSGGDAYFVISSGFVSFGRFARFFRDELGCTDALFLDGSVSSLWAPSLDRQDDNPQLGPLVVVLERD